MSKYSQVVVSNTEALKSKVNQTVLFTSLVFIFIVFVSSVSANTELKTQFQDISQLEKEYKSFKKNNRHKYDVNEAKILENLAKLYISSNQTKKAKQSYIAVAKIYRGLIEKTKNQKTNLHKILYGSYHAYLSSALTKLALMYIKENQILQEKKVHSEILKIYESLKKCNTKKCNAYEVFILQNIATLSTTIKIN